MKLLAFDQDRELLFNPDRDLGFDPGDGLLFDHNRGLAFSVNRDLPFGKRGVVFRGFVCPKCGALVLPDQKRCDECGVRFSRVEPPKKRAGKSKKRARRKRKAGKRARADGAVKYCTYCGVRNNSKDSFCWNCGTPAYGSKNVPEADWAPTRSGERVQLASKPMKVKVTKDWSETGYRMPEE